MTTVKQIFDRLCEIAPLSLQLPYDNAGFLVGRGDAAVSRVLLSLDITSEVVSEAREIGAKLIVSHHPVIWNKFNALTDENEEDDKVLSLLENGIAAICMHTNLDIAPGGVNDVLLGLFGLASEGCFEEEGCGRMGRFSRPLPLDDFLSLCKERLNTRGLRYYDAGRPVQCLAVLGGAGGNNLIDAHRAGCDTYLTADVKYSTFLLARELGVNLIDGDHFCTENPVMAALKERLEEFFPEIDFRLSHRHDQTARFY